MERVSTAGLLAIEDDDGLFVDGTFTEPVPP